MTFKLIEMALKNRGAPKNGVYLQLGTQPFKKNVSRKKIKDHRFLKSPNRYAEKK